MAAVDFPVWLGNVEKWIALGDDLAHWSRFEDFTLNLLAEVRAIAAHLDIGLSDKQAKGIAARYTIRAQQKANKLRKNTKSYSRPS